MSKVFSLVTFGAICLLLAGLAALSHLDVFRTSQEISPDRISKLSKFGFASPATIRIAPLIAMSPPESNGHYIIENGKETLCVSDVRDVDQVGGGLCSFRGEDIYFSTRSGTDPIKDGKVYLSSTPIRAHPVLILSFAAFGIFLLCIWYNVLLPTNITPQ